jgi:hypothetical protein
MAAPPTIGSLMESIALIWAKAGAARAPPKASEIRPAIASLDVLRIVIGGFLVTTVL